MKVHNDYFGMVGLRIGDRIYGPNDSVAVVSSSGSGTTVRVLKPSLPAPEGLPRDYDLQLVNYSLSLATKRIIGMAANETLEKDVFEYWYFQGRKLSEY